MILTCPHTFAALDANYAYPEIDGYLPQRSPNGKWFAYDVANQSCELPENLNEPARERLARAMLIYEVSEALDAACACARASGTSPGENTEAKYQEAAEKYGEEVVEAAARSLSLSYTPTEIAASWVHLGEHHALQANSRLDHYDDDDGNITPLFEDDDDRVDVDTDSYVDVETLTPDPAPVARAPLVERGTRIENPQGMPEPYSTIVEKFVETGSPPVRVTYYHRLEELQDMSDDQIDDLIQEHTQGTMVDLTRAPRLVKERAILLNEYQRGPRAKLAQDD